jgi:benzaldehyde dehydrogenase (NAD)
VLADADLDAAADAASFGAFMNSGQICMSTERIVVDAIGRGRARGPAGGPAAQRSSPATRATRARWSARWSTTRAASAVLELIADARAKGAEVLAGGEADGNVVAPTVVDRRHAGHAALRRGVVRPRGGDRAGGRPRRGGAAAQRHEYGLAAAVFGEDVDAALAVAPPDRVGHLPRQLLHRPRRAADAVRRRQVVGLGPLRGRAALEEFTELRWMTVQQAARQYPI